MKKCFLILLSLTLFVTIPLGAQQFGVKAGFNLANLSGDYEFVDLKSLNGFRIGGFLSLDLGGGLEIQPEVFYAQKGASYKEEWIFTDPTATIEGKLKLNYIEIPLLIKYKVASGSLEPFFFVGPYIGFKSSAKIETSIDVAGFEKETETEDLEGIKSTDFGAVLGAGINLSLGSMSAIVDLRYTMGMTNISDDLSEKVKNGVFSVNLGLGL